VAVCGLRERHRSVHQIIPGPKATSEAVAAAIDRLTDQFWAQVPHEGGK
jgi:hypothetical protein